MKRMKYPLPILTHSTTTKVQLSEEFPDTMAAAAHAVLANRRIGGGPPKGLLPIFSAILVGLTGVNMRTSTFVQFARTPSLSPRKAQRNEREHP